MRVPKKRKSRASLRISYSTCKLREAGASAKPHFAWGCYLFALLPSLGGGSLGPPRLIGILLGARAVPRMPVSEKQPSFRASRCPAIQQQTLLSTPVTWCPESSSTYLFLNAFHGRQYVGMWAHVHAGAHRQTCAYGGRDCSEDAKTCWLLVSLTLQS